MLVKASAGVNSYVEEVARSPRSFAALLFRSHSESPWSCIQPGGEALLLGNAWEEDLNRGRVALVVQLRKAFWVGWLGHRLNESEDVRHFFIR